MSAIREGIIKRLLLEMLFYEFRHIKFTYTSQDIFRSHKFFDYITYLEANDLININNINHHKTFYTLTDLGRLLAIIWTKRTDCPKEYAFLNRDVFYDY